MYGKPLHSQRVTVWSGISEFGIINCFEDETGNYVTVTSDRHVHKADESLFPEYTVVTLTLPPSCSKKDGVTAHTARQATNTLRPVFERRIISLYSDISGSTVRPIVISFL